MHRIIRIAMLALLMGSTASAQLAVRIKDVARFAGGGRYTLIGYGLVVGLAGTGDSDTELTQQTIANLLHNFNIQIDPGDLAAQNCAVVMVTVSLGDGGHKDDLLSPTIATVGDCSSLNGGELLLTPLLGEDGTPWAVAQGAVVIGGFRFGSSDGGGETQMKNHPTVGKLPNGAKLLRDVAAGEEATDSVRIFLKHGDYTTAVNMATAINGEYVGLARAINKSTVVVTVPQVHLNEGTLPVFLANLEQIRFAPDQRARLVFNERTGTIVIGRDVTLSSVAISHGSISVSIKSSIGVSQPPPFRSGGTTVAVPDEQTSVAESGARVNLVPEISSVGDLVDMLNALGVTPRDMMAIFVALQRSGALHAEIETL